MNKKRANLGRIVKIKVQSKDRSVVETEVLRWLDGSSGLEYPEKHISGDRDLIDELVRNGQAIISENEIIYKLILITPETT